MFNRYTIINGCLGIVLILLSCSTGRTTFTGEWMGSLVINNQETVFILIGGEKGLKATAPALNLSQVVCKRMRLAKNNFYFEVHAGSTRIRFFGAINGGQYTGKWFNGMIQGDFILQKQDTNTNNEKSIYLSVKEKIKRAANSTVPFNLN